MRTPPLGSRRPRRRVRLTARCEERDPLSVERETPLLQARVQNRAYRLAMILKRWRSGSIRRKQPSLARRLRVRRVVGQLPRLRVRRRRNDWRRAMPRWPTSVRRRPTRSTRPTRSVVRRSTRSTRSVVRRSTRSTRSTRSPGFVVRRRRTRVVGRRRTTRPALTRGRRSAGSIDRRSRWLRRARAARRWLRRTRAARRRLRRTRPARRRFRRTRFTR
jgi:hypothetical protein